MSKVHAAKSDPLPAEVAIRLAIQIASALEAAHTKASFIAILKPANILVTRSGRETTRLRTGEAGEPSPPGNDAFSTLTVGLTDAGAVVGTVAYMSPEQAQGADGGHPLRRFFVWAGVV